MIPVELYDGSSGDPICDVPQECINEVCRPGPADDVVAFWRKSNDVTWHMARPRLIEMLEESGAWTSEEMQTEDNDTLRGRALWMACWDHFEEAKQ